MYKWVQEPGVVARFMKGGWGELISALSLRKEHRLLQVRHACASAQLDVSATT